MELQPITPDSLDDEALTDLINIRNRGVEHHASEGNKAQHAIQSLTLIALVELQQRRKTDSAEPVVTVSFYRDGIEAAANWVDQQRESYDNEHGRQDNDTGSFEFGNDAQREYSDTLAEIAEGIRALHPNSGIQPEPGDALLEILKAEQKASGIICEIAQKALTKASDEDSDYFTTARLMEIIYGSDLKWPEQKLLARYMLDMKNRSRQPDPEVN